MHGKRFPLLGCDAFSDEFFYQTQELEVQRRVRSKQAISNRMQNSGVTKGLPHLRLKFKTASMIVTQRSTIMFPCHLTGYHVLWFDFGTVLFLENPKIRQAEH